MTNVVIKISCSKLHRNLHTLISAELHAHTDQFANPRPQSYMMKYIFENRFNSKEMPVRTLSSFVLICFESNRSRSPQRPYLVHLRVLHDRTEVELAFEIYLFLVEI